MRRSGRTTGVIGWALAALAALTLVIGAPEHVLDCDEEAGPVAELIVHCHAHTIMDHGQPGHACAAHCAAHVMAETPALFVVQPLPARPAAWAAAENPASRTGALFAFERPPKA